MKVSFPDIKVVLELAGLNKAKTVSGRLRISCPFVPFGSAHNHGDKNPSFSIYQSPSIDETVYTCTCKTSGVFKTLFKSLATAAMVEGDKEARLRFTDAQKAVDALYQGHHFTPAANDVAHVPKGNVFVEYPNSWLAAYPSLDYSAEPVNKSHETATQYLLRRGFKEHHFESYDIRLDVQRCMVGFAYYNHAGKLAGMRGRSYLTNDVLREKVNAINGIHKDVKHYCYTFKKDDVSYNNQNATWFMERDLVNNVESWKNRPTLVFESAIDAVLAGGSADGSVTASFGLIGESNSYRYDFFKGSAGIIYIGDSDRQGKDEPPVAVARKVAREHCLKKNIPYYDAYYPVGFKDFGEMCEDPTDAGGFIEDIYTRLLMVDDPKVFGHLEDQIKHTFRFDKF